ncbi:hypothetical protein PoB_000707900 [Plakobranchus ocellatus]|uniref:Uncharacterized protein n=1 Tax=Plakobranchus ocellatus TaxID=259542 RepID=A0AAV3YES5_9GAST|nr:hypothetical protein PoB_000707900 [Plakobranchus ocellatus]
MPLLGDEKQPCRIPHSAVPLHTGCPSERKCCCIPPVTGQECQHPMRITPSYDDCPALVVPPLPSATTGDCASHCPSHICVDFMMPPQSPQIALRCWHPSISVELLEVQLSRYHRHNGRLLFSFLAEVAITPCLAGFKNKTKLSSSLYLKVFFFSVRKVYLKKKIPAPIPLLTVTPKL